MGSGPPRAVQLRTRGSPGTWAVIGGKGSIRGGSGTNKNNNRLVPIIATLRKPRRQRQRERGETNGEQNNSSARAL